MQERGFSLLELITVLAIVAITVSIGLPNFRETIRNNRISTTANELLASMSLARTTAIQQRANVRICATADPSAANPACNNSIGPDVDWSNGWVILVDSARDNSYATKFSTTQLNPNLLEVVGPRGTIQFQRTGIPQGFNNSTFSVCDDRKGDAGAYQNMRNLILSAVGRSRVAIPKSAGELEC